MEIYVYLSNGSQQKQITHLESFCGSPSWSPDGLEICFNGYVGDANIFVASAEGTNLRQLTDHPEADVTPSWSRDGSWIYFASRRSGEYQIWKVPAGGGEPIQITKQGGFSAKESEDGYLYYTADENGEVRRTPLEGGEETPVLREALYFGNWALVSEGIYFISSEPTNEWVIRFHDFETGDVQTVSVPASRPRGSFLTVTPDERWFLFTRWERRETDIMLVENFR